MDERERGQLRAMKTTHIIRCRDIVQQQIPMAFKNKNLRALLHLQEWEMHYIDELVRRENVSGE